MSVDLVHVTAKIKFLSSNEGGRTTPVCGSYRPNHNFFDEPNSNMTVGFIELADGVEVNPGETITTPIAFWWWPGLTGQIYAGREWRIQEGYKLVAIGRVVEVQSEAP